LTPLPRPAAALACAFLAAFTLTACGGGPPTDASVADFCAAVNDKAWAAGLEADSSGKEIVEALGTWRDELEKTGTPDGIPDDARKGFEITVDTLGDLKAADFDSADDLANLNDDLSSDEQDQVDALTDYSTKSCGTG
jgi:hypothetical protein